MTERAEPTQSVDDLLVRSISRWAVAVALLILVFDAAVFDGYPFPGSSSLARGAFYVVFGLALLLATAAVTFLGYRIVSMRVARRARSVYPIFLPLIVLFSSILAALFLAAPR